jgi:hypothetical protein
MSLPELETRFGICLPRKRGPQKANLQKEAKCRPTRSFGFEFDPETFFVPHERFGHHGPST